MVNKRTIKIWKICYKANLETAKIYCIRESGLFDFFDYENLGVSYIRAKTSN